MGGGICYIRGMRPLLAGILLFDGVEVLDFAGPYEVFSITRPYAGEPGEPPLRLALVAREPVVTSISGLRVLADYTLGDCPPLDLLLIPGGPGVHAACADA